MMKLNCNLCNKKDIWGIVEFLICENCFLRGKRLQETKIKLDDIIPPEQTNVV